MYDVGRLKTFEALEGWLGEVRSKCAESVVVVLVGNKVDTDAREVSYELAAGWAKKQGLQYVETSAKRGDAVKDAFITLVASVAGRVGELSQLLKRAKVLTGQAPQQPQQLLAPKPPPPKGGCAC